MLEASPYDQWRKLQRERRDKERPGSRSLEGQAAVTFAQNVVLRCQLQADVSLPGCLTTIGGHKDVSSSDLSRRLKESDES